jgi:hypothetical protein
VSGSKPLTPSNNSDIILLNADTMNGLKVVKSLTEHMEGTHSPNAIGIGNALGIEISMYLKSLMLLQSS